VGANPCRAHACRGPRGTWLERPQRGDPSSGAVRRIQDAQRLGLPAGGVEGGGAMAPGPRRAATDRTPPIRGDRHAGAEPAVAARVDDRGVGRVMDGWLRVVVWLPLAALLAFRVILIVLSV